MHINDVSLRTQNERGVLRVKSSPDKMQTNRAREAQRMRDQAHTSALSRVASQEMRQSEKLNEIREDKIQQFKALAHDNAPAMTDSIVDAIYTRMFSQ